MDFSAKVLCDSISSCSRYGGVRLTTMEITLPRIVLSEFNTHRVFSRNSASSRAIPTEKRIEAVERYPFIPTSFGKNRKGMQAVEDIVGQDSEDAKQLWIEAMHNALETAKKLSKIGVHKQLANRLLEPFSWQTIVCTATEWDNFWGLRCNTEAQPEIRIAAELMQQAYNNSKPAMVFPDEYHLPLLPDYNVLANDGYTRDQLCLISVGRCARVSYLTHDGKRNPEADIELANRLSNSGHLSPFEHTARPMTSLECTQKYGTTEHPDNPSENFCGNFRGWVQYRKTLSGESVFIKK
jgi:thymidylate synthase ThyX